jgi:alpha-glucosidase
VLRFYPRFLAWRKGSEALRRGTIHFYQTPEPVLALRRETRSERILAVFNLSPEPIQYNLPASAESLEGHGLSPTRLDGRRLHLPAWGGFFGRMV